MPYLFMLTFCWGTKDGNRLSVGTVIPSLTLFHPVFLRSEKTRGKKSLTRFNMNNTDNSQWDSLQWVKKKREAMIFAQSRHSIRSVDCSSVLSFRSVSRFETSSHTVPHSVLSLCWQSLDLACECQRKCIHSITQWPKDSHRLRVARFLSDDSSV